MKSILAIVVVGFALASCHHAGAPVPSAVVGAWGVDCTDPFVTFGDGTMHVGPDKADYAIKSASMTGNDLTVSYDSANGAVTEHYLVEGDTLRLDRGTYAGQEATWHKAPMRRCHS